MLVLKFIIKNTSMPARYMKILLMLTQLRDADSNVA